MGHDDAVNCIAISPDGRYLASAGKSCRYPIRNMTKLRFLIPHAKVKINRSSSGTFSTVE